MVGLDEDGFVVVAPDLVVEVLSPNDILKETRAKIQQYLEAGSQLAWLVNPRKKQVEVYRMGATNHPILGVDEELNGEEILPGFKLPVNILFN